MAAESAVYKQTQQIDSLFLSRIVSLTFSKVNLMELLRKYLKIFKSKYTYTYIYCSTRGESYFRMLKKEDIGQ